ncbi:nucleoside monophosphate kinase [Candidatus Saccharibacteria bacterium]|nr:nucleoside monophosphate kinase [Candidatus Saccharibacteria bacterium]MBQ6150022.1 nucleoside monophosphate kinase [Candidatus Saccharibacteria bacterium]
MEDKIATIKRWLGTGSINIFGFPMSGKDTQGVKLAEAVGGKLLSSGIIIRAKEAELHKNLTGKGDLIPTDIFYEWVMPYFEREDLKKYPLILSSIGRWFGEEDTVLETAEKTGHPIKAAVLLNISEADVISRLEKLQILNDRGLRQDDKDMDVFKNRLEEFRVKTMPVLEHYKKLGLLINVNGDQSREEVFKEMVDKLYDFVQS